MDRRKALQESLILVQKERDRVEKAINSTATVSSTKRGGLFSPHRTTADEVRSADEEELERVMASLLSPGDVGALSTPPRGVNASRVRNVRQVSPLAESEEIVDRVDVGVQFGESSFRRSADSGSVEVDDVKLAAFLKGVEPFVVEEVVGRGGVADDLEGVEEEEEEGAEKVGVVGEEDRRREEEVEVGDGEDWVGVWERVVCGGGCVRFFGGGLVCGGKEGMELWMMGEGEMECDRKVWMDAEVTSLCSEGRDSVWYGQRSGRVGRWDVRAGNRTVGCGVLGGGLVDGVVEVGMHGRSVVGIDSGGRMALWDIRKLESPLQTHALIAAPPGAKSQRVQLALHLTCAKWTKTELVFGTADGRCGRAALQDPPLLPPLLSTPTSAPVYSILPLPSSPSSATHQFIAATTLGIAILSDDPTSNSASQIPLPHHTPATTALAHHIDRPNKVFAAHTNGAISSIDLPTSSPHPKPVQPHKAPISDIDLSPTHIAATALDGSLALARFLQ